MIKSILYPDQSAEPTHSRSCSAAAPEPTNATWRRLKPLMRKVRKTVYSQALNNQQKRANRHLDSKPDKRIFLGGFKNEEPK
jgi:hypothetical protein